MSKDKEAGQSLPDGGDELTAALAGKSEAELSAMRDELIEAFDAIHQDGKADIDADGFAKLEVLKTQILAVNATAEEVVTTRKANAERAAALRAAINPVKAEAADDEEGGTEAGDTVPEAAAPEARELFPPVSMRRCSPPRSRRPSARP